MKLCLAFGLPMAALLLLAACGGSEDDNTTTTETPSPSAAALSQVERDYLIQAGAALALFRNKAASFRATRSQTYPNIARLFDALYEAGAGTAFVDTLEAVEKLEPPFRFREDHVRLIQNLKERVRIDAAIGLAMADEDLVSFRLLDTELGVTGRLANVDLSPEVCKAIHSPVAQGVNPCRSGEPLPGGDYGQRLEVVMLRFDAQARTNLWPPIYRTLASDEEFLAGYVQLIPANITSTEQAIDELSELEPPNELLADHEQLMLYLDNYLALSLTRLQAAESRDMDRFESINQQLITSFCDTREALSEAIEPIVRVRFQNRFGCAVR